MDIVASLGGKITPELIPSMRSKAKEIALMDGCYYVDQFSNPDVLIGYEGLGRELLEQIPEGIHASCGAVGGAGMVMGVSRILKSHNSDCRVTVLEPASAPMMTKGYGGPHSVEGTPTGQEAVR